MRKATYLVTGLVVVAARHWPILLAFAIGIGLASHVAPGRASSQAWHPTFLKPSTQVLGRSCVPLDTGGGVTQCAQPTTTDSAILACFSNAGAYIGRTPEATFHLMRQCVDDYMTRMGWR